jgi:hypothetical protein
MLDALFWFMKDYQVHLTCFIQQIDLGLYGFNFYQVNHFGGNQACVFYLF